MASFSASSLRFFKSDRRDVGSATIRSFVTGAVFSIVDSLQGTTVEQGEKPTFNDPFAGSHGGKDVLRIKKQ